MAVADGFEGLKSRHQENLSQTYLHCVRIIVDLYSPRLPLPEIRSGSSVGLRFLHAVQGDFTERMAQEP